MFTNISAWSIRTPVPTIVLFLILTILGLVSFPMLGIDDSPNVDIPAVTVTVTQSGADPSELEFQVTKKVEDAVAGLGNIDHILSTVTDGSSVTTINFLLGTNSDRATNDVRNAISQIRQSLPQDINDPIVKRVDAAGSAIMSYAVASDRRSIEELSNLIDQTISRELLSVPGIAQVQRVGGVDAAIRVDLNPEQLLALGITSTQVNEQLRKYNINLPGGRTEVGSSEQSVRTLGSANSVDELKNYQIILPKGGSVPLSTLGEVIQSYDEVRQQARLNGQPVVAFSILRSTGTTLVTVAEGAQEAVKKLQKTLPPDIKIQLIFTQADHIRDTYQASIDAVILGAALAVITILVFLRDWRATLITAVALPLSAIPTFIVLKALDYTLNSMTLLALALVVGILVDDAIVEIENIERHVQMGKSPMQAALEASDEIGLAVVATSMTIVSVFVPVAFMGGIPGQYFRPFGVTVAVSVLFSLLVARTVTPLMSAYLLKDKAHEQHKRQKRESTPEFGVRQVRGKRKKSFFPLSLAFSLFTFDIEKPYRHLLIWALKHRGLTLLMAVVFFIGSLQMLPFIPKGFIDRDDTGLSTVSIELPPGSTLSQTDQAVQQATQILRQSPMVVNVLATEGSPAISSGGPTGGGNGGGSINTATLYVKLKPSDERKGEDCILVPAGKRDCSQNAFEAHMHDEFQEIPGVRISFAQGQVGGNKQVSIVLKSDNGTTLNRTANAIVQQMRQLPSLVDVTSTASLMKPEILIKPDTNRAADQGVSVQSIANTASIATIGDIDANLAKFNLTDRQIPIQVQLAPRFRNNIDTIKNLQILSNNNTLVPMSAVADISMGNGPSQIDRYDRARQVTVEANLEPGVVLGNALNAIEALPGMHPLPPEVTQEKSGDSKVMQDVFTGFALALATAVLLIYSVLVLLFNDFLHPVTIMVALPLSLGGALVGLLIAQKSIGLFALIGIVLLMGIVTKNSILLVDYALMNQKEGKPLYKAVLESGVARLRPIIMTTIAMVAGMVPIALQIGAGSISRSPMAIAVIGGLTTSTLLTLVVIPVIYTYVDGWQTWFTKRSPLKSRKSSLNTLKHN